MKKTLFLFLLVSFNVLASQDYIPPQAFKYKDIIHTELDTYFSDLYNYNYIPSLIELESCIYLNHKRCWSPTSQLKSQREEGAGLGQITRAYNKNGSIRFDALTDMARQYKIELRDARWETIYQRPDIQIRIIILMIRDTYNKLYAVNNKEDRLQMTDAAYNGGLGGLLKERRVCGMSYNCDPNVWFNNVENHCLKSNKAIYGTRSPCMINRDHTKVAFKNKLPKYTKQYFTNKD